MNFFNSLKQQVSSEELPHEREMRAYAIGRIQELESIKPVLSLYHVWGHNPADDAGRQIEALRDILAQFENNETIPTKIANLHYLAKAYKLAPFNRDVEAILDGRQPVLPAELKDIPEFLKREEILEREKREALAQQRRAEARAIKAAEAEEAKAAKRAALESDLGLAPGTLSGKGGEKPASSS